ncbi:MAG TPA: hypothetical protein VFX86_01985 [Candidatus Saccharimonadales bacterium]|nr:hypothetical protein [Candidatus Saccharimonadales bacterium]
MYQICVSGAAKGKSLEEGRELAYETGKVIARAGHSLLTGATVGIALSAAEGYKKAGGTMNVGISPATSKVEHVMKYRLPTKPYDTILYTGMHYVGRDVLLINSSDCIVSIGGRIGTLHEFAVALETRTPIGFLQGAGGISTEIMDILHAAGREESQDTIFSDDAEDLVTRLTELLDRRNKKYRNLYE